MNDTASRNKWNNIYLQAQTGVVDAVWVITEYAHLLPHDGKALDLACGLAANGIFLAKRGLQVDAWDISDVVVDKLNAYAKENNLPLNASVHDFTSPELGENQYDVIVVAHYLERALASKICEALKPGGLLCYQTFVRDVTPDYSGPGNPDFRLAPNEMLQLFSGLRVLAYREEGTVGEITLGLRNVAAFIGQKPQR
ncbi:MAG: methyltransferase domain-containing protein [Gammaproteobacteria bacterium]|nr:methyltransferase domain-containing protein [Gammaproteobacteria bacterium]